MDDYHLDISHISKSGLTLIDKAPAKYHWEYLSGRNKENDTKALLEGRAFHECTTQPELFSKNFVIIPPFKGEGSNNNRDEWKKENKGKQILTVEQYEMVNGMRDSLFNHKLAKKLLSPGGLAEKRFNWIDRFTGAPCKVKPDWITADGNWIIDLKSTEDASNKGFARSIKKYTYFIQDPYYLDGVIANGITPKGFLFIAVEKKPPYLVKIHSISNSYREYGRDCYREILKKYMDCKKNNDWPGYDTDINIVDLPDYL